MFDIDFFIPPPVSYLIIIIFCLKKDFSGLSLSWASQDNISFGEGAEYWQSAGTARSGSRLLLLLVGMVISGKQRLPDLEALVVHEIVVMISLLLLVMMSRMLLVLVLLVVVVSIVAEIKHVRRKVGQWAVRGR